MAIKVYDEKLSFSNTPNRRVKTDKIILHHAAGKGSVSAIHASHKKQGWAGIGYHFYIRANGKIYQGRPVDTVGAHCLNHNSTTIGICFEGNFCETKPTPAQIESGKQLVSALLKKYRLKAKKAVFGHKEMMATACPGTHFPLSEFKKLKAKKAEIRIVSATPKDKKSTTYKRGVVSTKTGSSICIRQKPGTQYKQIGSLNNGSYVTIVESTIKTSGGMKWGKLKSGGWISLSYVKWV